MLARCSSLWVALLALLVFSSAACAQVAPPDGTWQSSWTGRLWLVALNGDAVFQGNPVDIDVSVSDSLKSVDKMEAGFSGHYETRYQKIGLLFDVNYWRLKEDIVTDVGPGEIKPSQLILEVAGTGTISEKLMGDVPVQRIEGMLGARYNMLKLDVKVEGAGVDDDKSQNYFDPFVGVRYYQALAPQWGMNLRGDIGGFGIGSDLSWQIVATFGYHISKKNSILFGWRHYKEDFEEGEGAERFEWNVASYGPFIAFQSRF